MKTSALVIGLFMVLAAPAFADSTTTYTIQLNGGSYYGGSKWLVFETSPSGTFRLYLSPTNGSVSCCNFSFVPTGAVGDQGFIGASFSNIVFNSSTDVLTANFTGFACSDTSFSCSYQDGTEFGIAGTFTDQVDFTNGDLGKGQVTYTIAAPEPSTLGLLVTGLCGIMGAVKRRMIA